MYLLSYIFLSIKRMKKENLKVGAIVALKSGGPDMTVLNIHIWKMEFHIWIK